jgi:hypothetical protein
MTMRIIPIASRIGGILEIVKGTYAEEMLFKASNAEKFVDRMKSVLTISKKQIKEVFFALRKTHVRKSKTLAFDRHVCHGNRIGQQLLLESIVDNSIVASLDVQYLQT